MISTHESVLLSTRHPSNFLIFFLSMNGVAEHGRIATYYALFWPHCHWQKTNGTPTPPYQWKSCYVHRERVRSICPGHRWFGERVRNPLLHHWLISYVERDAQYAYGLNHTQKSRTNCERKGWATPEQSGYGNIKKKRGRMEYN